MKTQNLIFFCCFRKVPEGSRTARPAALRPGRGGQSGGQSGGLSARARESPFQRTKEEVPRKQGASSFLLFPEVSGRDSNSPSGHLASRPGRKGPLPAYKKQRACAFRKPSSLLPFRHHPLLGTARGKKMPPARRNLEPAGLGALLFSIDGCQRGKRFATRRGTVYAVSSPAARSPLWAALSAVEGRSWSTLVSNWAR